MDTQVHCELCGFLHQPGKVGTGIWTEGWVEVRADGGGHGVVAAVRHPRWCCRDCLSLLKTGNVPGQLSLLP